MSSQVAYPRLLQSARIGYSIKHLPNEHYENKQFNLLYSFGYINSLFHSYYNPPVKPAVCSLITCVVFSCQIQLTVVGVFYRFTCHFESR
ncbi:hypothetical protein BCV72DRAFT_117218 [Rhizopus microsporus var. microsporus]|uniref:Uncharacterized protein n=1 Tax=Rhizopus microsporus var. microsporus TaxID=86635 RepID=A0A1X0R4L5_RHIZD|nr:hypothetical protein BCV72DRAFT_117218 [Rhizopus microsporus var. microsporus]